MIEGTYLGFNNHQYEDDGSEKRSIPEMMDGIKSFLEEVANLDYPPVWVGKMGMTAHYLLGLQERNERLPEEMRLEPGQVVRVEGETDGGIKIPEVGGTRLNGLDVVRYLRSEMDEGQFAELWHEVMCVHFAKQRKVLINVFSLQGGWMPFVEPCSVPVDSLPPDLAEPVFDELEFFAGGGMDTGYVIPETERVKAFLAEHGEYFG